MRWAAAIALCVASAAHAREVARDAHGGVLELSGFYKSALTGFLLQPDAVEGARTLARLNGGRAEDVPEGGVVNTHVVRLASRFLFADRFELEVAWQAGLTLGKGGAQSPGASPSVSTAAGAQRRLIPLGGTLAQSDLLRLDHELDRFALKLPLPFGDLTIGRQVLSWGTGRVWNPTDVLSPFPPTAIDREVRRGFDAVRLAIALGDVTQLDLLWLPQLAPEDQGGVVRFQTNLKGWDGSVSFGKYVDDLVIGADLTGDLGPVGVHAEGAYTIQLVGMGTSAVTVGEHFFRGVVGAEVKPHEKVVLLAEYHYNGYGTADPSRIAKVLASKRVQRGEVFGAGKHQLALGGTWLANDLVSTALTVLMNLSDPSALVVPSVEWSVSQTVLLRAGGYVPIGRPPNAHAYDGLSAGEPPPESRGLRSEYGSASWGAFLQVGVYVP